MSTTGSVIVPKLLSSFGLWKFMGRLIYSASLSWIQHFRAKIQNLAEIVVCQYKRICLWLPHFSLQYLIAYINITSFQDNCLNCDILILTGSFCLCIGAFQNTRSISEEANVERGNLVYSTMNNAVTVPELIRISHGRHSVDSSVTVAHPQQLPRNTSENVESDNPASRPRNSSTENVEKMPERPQDLINKVSFGVAKVNFKSSAQYRKSYAFKIWREKGCFPFRLEDRPSSEDQKKSKRYLNAVKAQRDRNNEDAWRAYKSSKAKKAPTATQRPSEAVEVVGNTRSEGHHQTPFTASKDAVTKRNLVHSLLFQGEERCFSKKSGHTSHHGHSHIRHSR